MNKYDDKLPGRLFDNFQFVDYHSVTKKVWRSDLIFAAHALMEIPDQYKAIRALGLIENMHDDSGIEWTVVHAANCIECGK